MYFVGVGVGGWVYTRWCTLVLLRCCYPLKKKKTVLLCMCVPEQALTKEFKEKVSKGKCCVM